MHTHAIIFTALFVANSASAEPRQRVVELPAAVAEKTDNLNSKFWLYLPTRYDEDDAKLPLIIFLHGSSKRGTDLERVKANGMPPLLDKKEDWDFVVASPQAGYKYAWQRCWRPDDIALLLAELLKSYRIDPKRVYLTGLSMGGYGAWACAAAYPELFAAAVPICGGGELGWAEQYGELPIWAFHGADDYVVSVRRSQEMVTAINALGGKAKLTAYPGVGHDSFTQTYANPDMFAWLLRHSRRQ
ncbi:MAG: putative peptidase [Rhodothermales bacterium]|jgi:predicted peptidase